jgi:hypothetical protein
MSGLSPGARQWLATHHSIISAAQMIRLGVSSHAVRRLVERGDLEHTGNGLYRLAGTPRTAESLMVAACAQHPEGYVTGPAGGRLMRWRDMPPARTIEFCMPIGHGVVLEDGVTLRRSTRIDPRLDVRTRPDGIRVASPLRLAFDLATHCTDLQLSSLIEDLLHRRVVTLSGLRATAKRLGGRGRKGSAPFARVLVARVPGGALESGKEVRLAPLLVQRGIPIEAQVRLLDLPNGSSIRIDLAVPAVRWGIEIDLHPTHLFLEGTTADKQRDRQCHLIDWQIERVTRLDFLDLPACADELLALYRARCANLAARTHPPALLA